MTRVRKIPSVYVPKNYQPDIDGPCPTEAIVDGHDLRVGMIVVPESAILRGDADRFETLTPYRQQQVLDNAYWHRITKLVRLRRTILIDCEYADGRIRIRCRHHTGNLWVAKLPPDRPTDWTAREAGELMDIPSEFVPEKRLYDPSQEEIKAGDALQVGDIAILQFPDRRGGLDREPVDRANRWCRVLQRKSEGYINFVAQYSDGTETLRRTDRFDSWIVKKA